MDAPSLAVRSLKALGARCAFGLPGTQNLALLEALARHDLPLLVPTHELAASFAAGAWYRATGEPGLLLTIPGPGFTYALTGLAEARLDSLALVHLTVAPASGPGRRYQLQALDQEGLARPVAKAVHTVTATEEVGGTLARAWRESLSGEPGPVVVQLSAAALKGEAPWTPPSPASAPPAPDAATVEAVRRRLDGARRVVVLAGQGALGAADELRRLVEDRRALLLTTTSGRGVLDEHHPLSLGYETAGTREGVLNDLIRGCDLVLVLGAKLSHNAARGFRLDLPAQKLIHVDASPEVLEANYPASAAIQADVGAFLRALGTPAPAEGYGDEEAARWKERGEAESWLDVPEPRLAGRPARDFFEALARVLPADATLVADSGLHQLMARRWWRVRRPGGLLLPTDLQSMGFALPAALACAAAHPQRRTVAVVGDGGFLLSGMEVLTARKHGLPLTVLVVDDGGYGLIRRGQEAAWGRGVGSGVQNPDFQALAGALGVSFARLGGEVESELRQALDLPGVTLVQVPAEEGPGLKVARAKGRVKRWLGR